MKIIAALLLTLLPIIVLCFRYDKDNPFIFYDNIEDSPLILTSYIEEGRIESAKNDSAVKLSGFEDVESYAGYFTVDKAYNSNTFFWYFPAVIDHPEDAPVVLWLQGGPGVSSLYGLFLENGPFSYDGHQINRRKYSLNKKYHTIYLDNPVGTGFSFTNGGFAENMTIIGTHLHKALVQFFTVFPDLKNNDFYIVGESYAGKYIIAASSEIHRRNNNSDTKINLKGFAIGNGVISPAHQYYHEKFYYDIGILSYDEFITMKNMTKDVLDSVREGEDRRAYIKYLMMYGLYPESFTIRKTGTWSKYDITVHDDLNEIYLKNLIYFSDLRQAVHAGKIRDVFDYVYFKLASLSFIGVTDDFVELLGDYKAVIYHGQLDTLVNYRDMDDFLMDLQFPGSDEYRAARQELWKVDGKLAGYIKKGGNLTMALVLGAGHSIGEKMPERMISIVDILIGDK